MTTRATCKIYQKLSASMEGTDKRAAVPNKRGPFTDWVIFVVPLDQGGSQVRKQN